MDFWKVPPLSRCGASASRPWAPSLTGRRRCVIPSGQGPVLGWIVPHSSPESAMNAEATPSKGLKITVIILRTLMGLLFLFSSAYYFLKLPVPPLSGDMKTFNDGLMAASRSWLVIQDATTSPVFRS